MTPMQPQQRGPRCCRTSPWSLPYPIRMLCATLTVVVAVATAPAAAQDGGPVEWRYVGADQANTRSSPADQVTPTTVDQLEQAWTWRPEERARPEYGTVPGSFTSTPIMINDTVYVSSNYNRVAALDAETGAERWVFDPRAYEDGMPALGGGFRHRGVTAWRDGAGLRIFLASPFPAVLSRRRDGRRHYLVRRRRRGGPEPGSDLADRPQPLRVQRGAGRLQRPSHRRQRRRRPRHLPADAAGRRPRLRRADRRAGLELSHDSAGGRARQPDLGERGLALQPAPRTSGPG